MQSSWRSKERGESLADHEVALLCSRKWLLWLILVVTGRLLTTSEQERRQQQGMWRF